MHILLKSLQILKVTNIKLKQHQHVRLSHSDRINEKRKLDTSRSDRKMRNKNTNILVAFPNEYFEEVFIRASHRSRLHLHNPFTWLWRFVVFCDCVREERIKASPKCVWDQKKTSRSINLQAAYRLFSLLPFTEISPYSTINLTLNFFVMNHTDTKMRPSG